MLSATRCMRAGAALRHSSLVRNAYAPTIQLPQLTNALPVVSVWKSSPIAAAYSKSAKEPPQLPDVKLPNRDQVERIFFKVVVVLWDFSYKVFCFLLHATDQYILKNATFQYYWKLLLKRLEEARNNTK